MFTAFLFVFLFCVFGLALGWAMGTLWKDYRFKQPRSKQLLCMLAWGFLLTVALWGKAAGFAYNWLVAFYLTIFALLIIVGVFYEIANVSQGGWPALGNKGKALKDF